MVGGHDACHMGWMDNERPVPICPKCCRPMKLVRTIPRVGTLPQLEVFYCSECNEAETREESEKAA
jgi:hypothetical protein